MLVATPNGSVCDAMKLFYHFLPPPTAPTSKHLLFVFIKGDKSKTEDALIFFFFFAILNVIERIR